jgi:DNA polymerase-1
MKQKEFYFKGCDVEPTVIIDLSYEIYRALYSSKKVNFTASNGMDTSGIYIFLKQFQSYMHFGNCIFVRDTGRSKRRKEIFVDYKERSDNRQEYDEIFLKRMATTFDFIPKFLKKCGIPIVSVPNSEADDVVYRLCQNLKNTKLIVITEDNDYMQLLEMDNVEVYKPKSGITVSKSDFTMNNFDPKLFVLYKSLVGDSSDNVPNIPKIGEVTAKKIIKEVSANWNGVDRASLYDLKVWYSNLTGNEKDDKLKAKIMEHFKQVAMNYELLNIDNPDVKSEDVISSYMGCLSNLTEINPKEIREEFLALNTKTLGDLYLYFMTDRVYPKL